MKVLVTGGAGFVAKAVLERLFSDPIFNVVYVTRKPLEASLSTPAALSVGDINGDTNWFNALQNTQMVLHLAARAHILSDKSSNPLAAFRQVNVEGTLNLAYQAAESGVKRFIFISSIGVNGNINARPFSENDALNPAEPYAVSKYEAEIGLQEIAKSTGMEVVIIRPPLVYGPNAPGNLGSLLKWVNKSIPLPLGAIHNQRSLVALDNLVDFIVTCIDHPAAANQTFLVSDGEDLSTSELLQRVGHAMGKPARLFPVPTRLLNLGAALLGKKAMAQRLCGSLQVDISKARRLLGWNPPISVDEGLRRAVQGFKT